MKMHFTKAIFLILVVLIVVNDGEPLDRPLSQICPNQKKPLSAVRKRRHLAFPDGSNVVLTASLVKTFMTHMPSGWNIALELDVLYPLPNVNFTVAHAHRKKLLHRQKRELWQRMEDAFSFHNLDGRACVLKSICDAKVYLLPPGKSLVHDILRAIFTVPELDDEFREEIQGSYKEVLTPQGCNDIAYCPMSLLNFIFSLKS